MTQPQALPTGVRLVRSVVRNAFSNAAGRVLLTALRFGVVLIIVRRAGFDSFGAYALVLSLVMVAEWIADFGHTDIAVRELAAHKRPWEAVLGGLGLVKIAQGLIAAPLVFVLALVLGHGGEVVFAALLAGLAVLMQTWVLLFRAVFRAQLRMGRDVSAELIGAVVLVGATWWATSSQPSLLLLVGCYVLARAVHLVAAALLAGGWPRMRFAPGGAAEAGLLLRAAWPVGVSGLLVSVYDAMDAIALARWADAGDVGVFNAASRVLMLAVIVVQGLSVAVFPVLAAQWQRDREAFTRTMQSTLDIALLLGGFLFCATWCGAAGIAAFFKHDQAEMKAVLQLLAWALLARVLITVFGPMVLISGRQVHTLWMTATVVLGKALALAVLLPRADPGDGAVAAAWASVFSEIGVGLVPTVLLCLYLVRVRLSFGVPLRSLGCAVAVVAAAAAMDIAATLWHGLAGGLAFLLLAAAVGAVPVADLKRVAEAVKQRRSAGAPP